MGWESSSYQASIFSSIKWTHPVSSLGFLEYLEREKGHKPLIERYLVE